MTADVNRRGRWIRLRAIWLALRGNECALCDGLGHAPDEQKQCSSCGGSGRAS